MGIRQNQASPRHCVAVACLSADRGWLKAIGTPVAVDKDETCNNNSLPLPRQKDCFNTLVTNLSLIFLELYFITILNR